MALDIIQYNIYVQNWIVGDIDNPYISKTTRHFCLRTHTFTVISLSCKNIVDNNPTNRAAMTITCGSDVWTRHTVFIAQITVSKKRDGLQLFDNW